MGKEHTHKKYGLCSAIILIAWEGGAVAHSLVGSSTPSSGGKLVAFGSGQ